MWRHLYADYNRKQNSRTLDDLAPHDCFERIKTLGNRAFQAERYQEAIDAYSFALCYKFDATTLSNRSMAYLNLGM